jgi:hypothetical protein
MLLLKNSHVLAWQHLRWSTNEVRTTKIEVRELRSRATWESARVGVCAAHTYGGSGGGCSRGGSGGSSRGGGILHEHETPSSPYSSRHIHGECAPVSSHTARFERRESPTGCRTRRPLMREVGTGPRYIQCQSWRKLHCDRGGSYL